MTVSADLSRKTLAFSRNGIPIGVAFEGIMGPLIAVVTLANEESKVTIQNRPTVLNTGEATASSYCCVSPYHTRLLAGVIIALLTVISL